MSGERKNHSKKLKYGTLVMHPYVIFGNDIAAFYDSDDNLVFVLDNTLNAHKPNVLLVINSEADKKWDEILSNKYKVDLENIRPKQDNKYQKLDIEYSGLNVYENLIKAYDDGNDLSDHLNQLEILRDSAVRHSAMSRLDAANEIIAKTNTTILKTKETIVELQNRLKTLRAKLSAQKKEIGKISTKQSAAKILRTESQIEATNEKLKRAKKRLESAQRRLEVATNDAEIASNLLNQPGPKYVASVSKPVVVAPKYEVQTTEEPDEDDDDDFEEEPDEEESDDNNDSVKPLFDTDPNILNEDMAFKPISFDVNETDKETNTPVINFDEKIEDEEPEEKPEEPEDFVAPVSFEPVVEQEEPVIEEKYDDVPPIINTQALFDLNKDTESDDDVTEEANNAKSVLESMTPVYDYEEKPVVEEQKPIEIKPVEEVVQQPENIPVQNIIEPEVPVIHPVENTFVEQQTPVAAPVVEQEVPAKSKFAYYFLLIVLILLSVFTLWLYQKSMVNNNKPVLTPKTSETVVEDKQVQQQVDVKETAPEEIEETVFLDGSEPETVPEQEPEQSVVVEEGISEPEPVLEPDTQPVEESEPVIETEPEEFLSEPEPETVVPEETVDEEQQDLEPAEQENTQDMIEEETEVVTEEVVVDKPEYDVGSKDDDLFVVEGGENPEDYSEEEVFLDEE